MASVRSDDRTGGNKGERSASQPRAPSPVRAGVGGKSPALSRIALIGRLSFLDFHRDSADGNSPPLYPARSQPGRSSAEKLKQDTAKASPSAEIARTIPERDAPPALQYRNNAPFLCRVGRKFPSKISFVE